MNYINQINAFWEKIESDSDLKPTSVIVYLALLQINNKCGWKVTFKATYGMVLNMTGIANDKTYYSALKQLVDKGYINYQKGPNQYQAASFTIKMLYQNLEEHGRSNREASTGAIEEHLPEHGRSHGDILKQENNKQETIKQQTSIASDVEVDLSFEKEILSYFGFNELANIDKLRTITAFITKQRKSGGLEYFKKQYLNYKKYKQLSGEKKHNFTSFLGWPEKQFEGGKWDEANWELKFLEVSKHGKSNERSNPRVRPVPTAGRPFE